MDKLRKIIQCIRYRNVILGTIGIENRFEFGTRIESTTIIGNYNYFSFRVMSGNARIGNYCSFGPEVKIGQSKHSVNYLTTSQLVSSITIGHSLIKEPAIIGNDVWVGANAVIMQGVKIGNGAVIGANAVVTKDVPDYAIVAGVPATILRYRFSKNVVEKISNSNWWDYDVSDACKILQGIINDSSVKNELIYLSER